jgi:hypothetical protein
MAHAFASLRLRPPEGPPVVAFANASPCLSASPRSRCEIGCFSASGYEAFPAHGYPGLRPPALSPSSQGSQGIRFAHTSKRSHISLKADVEASLASRVVNEALAEFPFGGPIYGGAGG